MLKEARPFFGSPAPSSQNSLDGKRSAIQRGRNEPLTNQRSDSFKYCMLSGSPPPSDPKDGLSQRFSKENLRAPLGFPAETADGRGHKPEAEETGLSDSFHAEINLNVSNSLLTFYAPGCQQAGIPSDREVTELCAGPAELRSANSRQKKEWCVLSSL